VITATLLERVLIPYLPSELVVYECV
jgi:hypothetical protein